MDVFPEEAVVGVWLPLDAHDASVVCPAALLMLNNSRKMAAIKRTGFMMVPARNEVVVNGCFIAVFFWMK